MQGRAYIGFIKPGRPPVNVDKYRQGLFQQQPLQGFARDRFALGRAAAISP